MIKREGVTHTVKNHGDLYECPYGPCDKMLLPVGARGDQLIPVHTLTDGKPCPGGGFGVNKPAVAEMRKMIQREKGSR